MLHITTTYRYYMSLLHLATVSAPAAYSQKRDTQGKLAELKDSLCSGPNHADWPNPVMPSNVVPSLYSFPTGWKFPE